MTSVAWDLSNTDHNVSQTILVGSSKGQLFECVLDASDKTLIKVWKPVFNTESNQAIEGLAVERVGVSKLYIMAVTATRIYEFCGSTNFSSVFEQLSRKIPF